MSIGKVTEITAQSSQSFEDAIEKGMARTAKTLKNIQSAWIKEQKVSCDENGKITAYRVDMKVTFLLED